MKNDEDINKLIIEVAKLLQVEIAPEHILTYRCLSPKPIRNGEKNPPPLLLLLAL